MSSLVQAVDEKTRAWDKPGTLSKLDRERLLTVAQTLTLMAEPGWLPADLDPARAMWVVDYVLARAGEIERLLGVGELSPGAARVLKRVRALAEGHGGNDTAQG